MSDLRMFMEDGCVVIEAPGHQYLNEKLNGNVVTYPLPARVYGTDPKLWPNTGWRIRVKIPKDMVIDSPPSLYKAVQTWFHTLHPDKDETLRKAYVATLGATQAEDAEDSLPHRCHWSPLVLASVYDGKQWHPCDPSAVAPPDSPELESLRRSVKDLFAQLEEQAQGVAERTYLRRRVDELCGQLDAVDQELLGTPVVADVKDRKHPQWSLGLAPARSVREELCTLKRQNAELQHQIQWWIDTCNYNVYRASCKEGAVELVRKAYKHIALQVEGYESSMQTCNDAELGLLEGRVQDLRHVTELLTEALAAAEPKVETSKRGDHDVTVRGDWMQTFSGKVFWPLEPKAEDICLEDIAHALANTCRFSGHVSEYYSVAQHCVLASAIVPPEDAKWALLHDAAEAYISDLVRPIKHSPGGLWFRRIEAGIMRCVCERFGLPIRQPKSVDEADLVMLGTERRDLMASPPRPWKWVGKPMATAITPWGPHYAEQMFLNRAKELGLNA